MKDSQPAEQTASQTRKIAETFSNHRKSPQTPPPRARGGGWGAGFFIPRMRNVFRNRLALWGAVVATAAGGVSITNISPPLPANAAPTTKVAMSATPVMNATAGVNPHLVRTLEGHKGTVEALAFSPDGKILASGGGSFDPKIRLWDMRTGDEIRTLKGHNTRVLALAIAADGQTLASGSDDSTLNFWNLKTGDLSYRFMEPASNIMSLAISPNGQTLVSGGLDGLKVWDAIKQRPVTTLLPYESVYSVAISPNNLLLASGSKDATVKVWNLASGELLATLKGHTQPVSALAFTPDSKTLVTASYDASIKMWDIQTGQLAGSLLGHDSQINSLAMRPDGKILASAGQDGIGIWDLKSRKLINKFPGHSDWVQSLAFSPDGQMLASGGYDRTVKIWQIGASPEKPVVTNNPR